MNVDSKICKKCNILKDISEFYLRNRKTVVYVSPQCIDCTKINRKNKYESNKKFILEQTKLKYNENKEEINKRRNELRKLNPEKQKENDKKYYEKNKNKKKIYNKVYYEKNKDEIIEQHKEYVSKNKNRIRDYFRNYVNNRIKTDIEFKIIRRLRSRMHKVLNNNKNDKTVKLIGCSVVFFMNWIELHFDILIKI